MTDSLQAQQQAFKDAYFQLSAAECILVQLFAVLGRPVNRVEVAQLWSQIIQKPGLEQIQHLNQSQFNKRVNSLLEVGVLIQERGQGPRCPDLLIDIAIRDAIELETFEPIAQVIQKPYPLKRAYCNNEKLYTFRDSSDIMYAFRLAAYHQNISLIQALEESCPRTQNLPQIVAHPLWTIFNHPFDLEWFSHLSEDFQQFGLQRLLEIATHEAFPVNEAFTLAQDIYQTGRANPKLKLSYAEQLWLRGDLAEVDQILNDLEADIAPERVQALRGAIAFLQGDHQAAIGHYQQSLKALGKSKTAKLIWLQTPTTLLYFFALLKAGSPTALKEAAQHCIFAQREKECWVSSATAILLAVLQVQQGKGKSTEDAQEYFEDYRLHTNSLVALLEAYSLYWLDLKHLHTWLKPQLVQHYQAASLASYHWLALEFAELIARLKADKRYQQAVENLRSEIGGQPLINSLHRQEAWELSLNALINIAPLIDQALELDQATFRWVWLLEFKSIQNCTLRPIEQKWSIKSGWTKGKAIALKHLLSPSEMPDYMTPQDRQIANTLEKDYDLDPYSYYEYNKPTYTFGEEALLALVGHPLVFWADAPNVRVDVVAGEPELVVKQVAGDRLRLEMQPAIPNSAKILAFKETPTRLKVIAVKQHHLQIAEILGSKNRLEVPAQVQDKVLQAIAAVSNLVTVQSDIGGDIEAEEVPADPTLRVHLLPAGEGLKVSILAHPFPEEGNYYEPGKGGAMVVTKVGDKQLKTQRNLKAEKQRLKEIKAACPILQQHTPAKGEWLVEDPANCLELLVQLQELGDRIRVEWPEGEKFRVSRRLGLSDFRFHIRQQQDWFAASGEVQVSEDQVLDLQHLLALLEKSPGSFIQLSEGQFLALTEEFRQRLQMLNRLTEAKGKEIRVHGLAALALDEMTEGVDQLKVDQAWKQHIKTIQAARTLQPQVPEALQATLRDYQLEGFTWLARLAQWGVGACLADDMGLGKTLQAIAVILTRCDRGPTLVIAPTSVCMNWISEVEKFAPSLQVKSFGSGDRQQVLDTLEPSDLLVCSYSLLQQDEVAAMLAQVHWQTIVLDEAQAIKNQDTKRSQAAMALQGEFKIITTGTPIENHLGELWNLFRFINPGLLGSLDSFNQRFAYPIERDQNNSARKALRRLIQPFILRRTKDQVLKELPSCTEVTLKVELSADEMAFYEALRREAIAKLSESDAPSGQKHLQVLAEIMRLRRACCNPNLVRPELALRSSKLEQFGEVLAELLDNGHKAIVFSQFVDHLTILRKYLDNQQITYQYLDGSTPAKQRKQRVDAFQNGEGDVFLISLKAGGTGLNLTAADYVIHMDPWWNPAVEDQASDRAYRIGQQRPVTIYRLVAQGTIEDKIIALHQTKRDLADSLLSGTNVSGKISTEELLSLIQS